MGADHRRGCTVNLKVLVSYAYWLREDLSTYIAQAKDAGNTLTLFVDSGAVSAHNLGWEIDLDNYIEWVRAHQHEIAAYANLDVITDHKATAHNQAYMESKGVHPIPVFHRGEPWSVLEGMVEHYPYIGLGGAVPDSVTGQTGSLMRWLIGCFRRRRNSVFHGLGMLRGQLLDAFPFYSTDASSWQSGAQYGALKVWDRRQHRIITVKQHDGVSMLKHTRAIRDYGEDPKLLAGKRADGYHFNQALRVGLFSTMAYEAWLRRRHGPVKLKGQPNGLHIYAATASTNHVNTITQLGDKPSWI
jgi:hypothetical protein